MATQKRADKSLKGPMEMKRTTVQFSAHHWKEFPSTNSFLPTFVGKRTLSISLLKLHHGYTSKNSWKEPVYPHHTYSIFSVHVRYMSSAVRLAVCRLSSVVCNVGAPYSGDWNFPQCFYALCYLGHRWPLYKNFTEIVPGKPSRRGGEVKPNSGSQI